MRTFIIRSIVNFQTGEDLTNVSTLYDTGIELTPKLGTTLDINGHTFRCIEHRPGHITLKNDTYIVYGIEKSPTFVIPTL
jgi:hypothetical protein